MKKRLFFLRQDGWFETEISGGLMGAPDEELLRWIYAMMDRYGYRNYVITENPECNVGINIKFLTGNYL
jgi:hypothetical protein